MNDTDQSGPPDSPIWALLIGIDAYEHARPLRGCVNDVRAVERFFQNSLGVPKDHIRTVIDGQATRANILESIREFLIENPAINRNDQIYIHYSGHGSQMPDTTGQEPDGKNETLVSVDSRSAGVYDIPDKTIGALLDQLAQKKGENITVFLDCCHSGSGTRNIKESRPNQAQTRRLEADNRLPPKSLDAELIKRAPVATRGAGPSGWGTNGIPYVLLAACRDREEAQEYQAKGEGEGDEVTWCGAFSYFTLQMLKDTSPTTTYADLHRRVAAQVNTIYPTQLPQCEGQRDRVVFGGKRIERDPFIPVQRVDGDTVTLGAGLLLGLNTGTKLALYPNAVRTREERPKHKPLATVEVTSSTAIEAQAKIEGPQVAIPADVWAVITEQVYQGQRQTVALEDRGGGEEALEALRQRILEAESSYLYLMDDPNQPADLRVVAEEGRLAIRGADDESLVAPEDMGGVDQVFHALESISSYRRVQSITNTDPGSAVAGNIKVELRRFEGAEAEPKDLPPDALGEGGEVTLTFHSGEQDRAKNQYVVEVINESQVRVYPHIFYLSPDYSIQRLFPNQGQGDAIEPDQSLISGLANSKEPPFEIYLPEGWDTSRDYLKVIVTTEPTDLGALQQPALDVPPPGTRAITRGAGAEPSALDQLLDTVLSGKQTRHARQEERKPGQDWGTVELPLTVARQFKARSLDSGTREVELGHGFVLEKPAEFRGSVTLATQGQASRGDLGDPGLKGPPGLERFPDLFQPIGKAGTRSVGHRGLVFAFEVDEASQRSVNVDNALRLKLPPDATHGAEDVVPVVFDGEDYLVAGYTESPGVVRLVTLPPAVEVPGAGGRPTSRGIGRTIRLFLYKKLGRHTDTGLRRAGLEGGRVVYRKVDRDHFKEGQTVALFVHGFTSDTRWMIEVAEGFLRPEVLPYDHLLTWDYETFGTQVEESGQQLALALTRECGFGPDDGITLHVYAHSMGSVVSRAMIELFGGHAFVDRFAMAGPPNQGTTLANLARGGLFVATALLNRASVIPPLGAAGWVVKQLFEQGMGVGDLKVDSPILQRLNALNQPSNVPYLVLVGENDVDEQEGNRLERLAKKVLDKSFDAVFDEQNDVVIGVSSMQGVRGGTYPEMTTTLLPCDHFHYFEIEAGRRAIKEWVSAYPTPLKPKDTVRK